MTTIKIKFRASSIEGRCGVLVIQLIHNRNVKLITTKIRVREFEWDAKQERLVFDKTDIDRSVELFMLKKELKAELFKLQEIIARLEASNDYTTADIVECYLGRPSGNTLYPFMEKRIRELDLSGNTRTAEAYRSTLRCFLAFRSGKDMPLSQINDIVLCDFERHLFARNVTKNTSSFYMRILRTIYRRAASKGIIDDKQPFRSVYTGIDKTVKRAVDESVIHQLLTVKRLPKALMFARDMFMFSFYARGMSFVDMFYLKKENLVGDLLYYTRTKTGQQLCIRIEECMRQIIDRYSYDARNGPYIFPFIKDNGHALSKQHASALRLQNKRLKAISAILNLNQPLTSYVSRHTWASVAKRKGISMSVISESMGHTSEATTRIYLASFDQNVLDNANLSIISSL